jgi:hypothetical protein
MLGVYATGLWEKKTLRALLLIQHLSRIGACALSIGNFADRVPEAIQALNPSFDFELETQSQH